VLALVADAFSFFNFIKYFISVNKYERSARYGNYKKKIKPFQIFRAALVYDKVYLGMRIGQVNHYPVLALVQPQFIVAFPVYRQSRGVFVPPRLYFYLYGLFKIHFAYVLDVAQRLDVENYCLVGVFYAQLFGYLLVQFLCPSLGKRNKQGGF